MKSPPSLGGDVIASFAMEEAADAAAKQFAAQNALINHHI